MVSHASVHVSFGNVNNYQKHNSIKHLNYGIGLDELEGAVLIDAEDYSCEVKRLDRPTYRTCPDCSSFSPHFQHVALL